MSGDSMLLSIKVLLVPAFLLFISIIGRWFGPKIAGWLAGLPLVAGPILFVLALEQDSEFARSAATAATSAVFAAVLFSAVYARVSRRAAWPKALAAALLAWLLAACVLVLLPNALGLSLAIALGALLAAPTAFPAAEQVARPRKVSSLELVLRMAAGAALTLAVSWTASAVGGVWSGLLAVFPVLASILAVFTHRAEGAAFTAALLRAMVTGLYSFTTFCAVLAFALQETTVPVAFAIAVCTSIAIQVLTGRYLAK